MTTSRRLFLSFMLGGSVIGSHVQAEELYIPFLAGVTIGIPVGAGPPPGLYSGTTFLYGKGHVYNGSGQATNIQVAYPEISQTFLLATPYKILGGQYSAFINQSGEGDNVTIAKVAQTFGVGAVNTIISPLNLSWVLGNGFFVSYGDTVYLKDATYKVGGLRTGNNFYTLEQAVGISYLDHGYNFTANSVIDLNAKDTLTNYRSGASLAIDFTAVKAFGKFQFGVGGFFTDQFTDDKLNGFVVAESPYNGRGNRSHEAGVGPYLSYDFGRVNLAAWYTQDVYAVNNTKVGTGWIRMVIPLGDPLGFTKPVPRVSLANRQQP